MPEFDANYEASDQQRMSEVEEDIAPAMEIARRKEEYLKMREEKERVKQEAIERKQRAIEEGIDDHDTNLPLEMLVKQKLEDEIKMKAMGAMQQTA